MSSLRTFRFQKTPTKPVANQLVRNGSNNSFYGADTDHESSQGSSPFMPPAKKLKKALTDSEDESSQNGSNNDLPSAEVIEARLNCLQRSLPDLDRMDLQDALARSEWSVQKACDLLRPSTNAAKKAVKVKKMAVKYHSNEGRKDHQSGDESDSENEYGDDGRVYNSDDDSDDDEYEHNQRPQIDENRLTEDQKRVLRFFNTATEHELVTVQGCSKKKVENILELRPYEGWGNLVKKLQMSKSLNTEMLNSTTLLLKMRDAVSRLMEKCEKITHKMESMVENLTKDGKNQAGEMELTEQPKSLNQSMKLTGYQMIGLNWLVLMHKQALNGILADEMGLGKTIQAIAFLAHLKESGHEERNLIVVPSSTMENWQKEIELWCPELRVLNYYGSQDERRAMRLQIVQEQVHFDVILTTYNMVISSSDDRVLFRKLSFHYVIFDEAHMLKNMNTARYENLMRVQATRKLLLTGTPLQNNLVELMSLLVFVMPDMFANKKEQLKKMFAMFPKTQERTHRSKYEKDRIAHARRIMKPFFLRRLKSEVLTELPKKTEIILKVPMTPTQQEQYVKLVSDYKERAKRLQEYNEADDDDDEVIILDDGEEVDLKTPKAKPKSESGVGLLMNLRKSANHPLLIRNHYDDDKLKKLAKLLKKEDPGHKQANVDYIIEDLSVLTDFLIHKTCLAYRCIEQYSLGNQQICDSGKFKQLDKLLPDMKERDDRVLLFSQFVMVLDVLEQYLRIRGHKYLRLDGSTPVQERQQLIDQFNTDDSIFIFILSTKAGGLGINLTAANTVILHDLDFNPYNDKQAEDRCHRVGQTRPVTVYRLLSETTIEEGINVIAQDKLKLERDLAATEDVGGGNNSDQPRTTKKDIKKLLRIALEIEMSDKALGDVGKVYTDL